MFSQPPTLHMAAEILENFPQYHVSRSLCGALKSLATGTKLLHQHWLDIDGRSKDLLRYPFEIEDGEAWQHLPGPVGVTHSCMFGNDADRAMALESLYKHFFWRSDTNPFANARAGAMLIDPFSFDSKHSMSLQGKISFLGTEWRSMLRMYMLAVYFQFVFGQEKPVEKKPAEEELAEEKPAEEESAEEEPAEEEPAEKESIDDSCKQTFAFSATVPEFSPSWMKVTVPEFSPSWMKVTTTAVRPSWM
jgi:hypothetical protein